MNSIKKNYVYLLLVFFSSPLFCLDTTTLEQDDDNIVVIMPIGSIDPEDIIIMTHNNGGYTTTLQVVTPSGFDREVCLPCAIKKGHGEALLSLGVLRIVLPKDKSRISKAIHPGTKNLRKTEIAVRQG